MEVSVWPNADHDFVLDDAAEHIAIQRKTGASEHSPLVDVGDIPERIANALNEPFVAGHWPAPYFIASDTAFQAAWTPMIMVTSQPIV